MSFRSRAPIDASLDPGGVCHARRFHSSNDDLHVVLARGVDERPSVGDPLLGLGCPANAREVRRRVVDEGDVVPVAVDRDVVEEPTSLFEQREHPPGLVDGRGEDLDVLVDATQVLGRLSNQRRPRFTGLLTDLPHAVVLVADAPERHTVRILVPVLGAEVRPPAPDRPVRVLEPVGHLLRGARAGVRAEVRIGAQFLAPGQELVGPERVRVDHTPGRAVHRRTVRSDAVEPVVRRHEASARPPDVRDLQLTQRVEDVEPEPPLVRVRRAGLEDPAVRRAMELLEELPEDVAAALALRSEGLRAHRRRDRMKPRWPPPASIHFSIRRRSAVVVRVGHSVLLA